MDMKKNLWNKYTDEQLKELSDVTEQYKKTIA